MNEQEQAIRILNLYGIHTDDGYFVDNALTMFCSKDIINRTFSFLHVEFDSDNLISLEALKDKCEIIGRFPFLSYGYFCVKDSQFAIMLHPYFRRSHGRSNNFNTELLAGLFDISEASSSCSLKLRIDSDCIMLSEHVHSIQERERWSGPYFTDNIPDNKTDVTRFSSDSAERMINGSSFTEFWWNNNKDGTKQLEIEEIHSDNTPNLMDEMFGCKYIHSLYDPEKKIFIHFDGAVRAYTQDQISDRQYTSMNRIEKHSVYTKLFRMDGAISLDNWKFLISSFMIRNKSVREYFEGR